MGKLKEKECKRELEHERKRVLTHLYTLRVAPHMRMGETYDTKSKYFSSRVFEN